MTAKSRSCKVIPELGKIEAQSLKLWFQSPVEKYHRSRAENGRSMCVDRQIGSADSDWATVKGQAIQA